MEVTGGGDGVEFYFTFPNGNQWGWRANSYWLHFRTHDLALKRQGSRVRARSSRFKIAVLVMAVVGPGLPKIVPTTLMVSSFRLQAAPGFRECPGLKSQPQEPLAAFCLKPNMFRGPPEMECGKFLFRLRHIA
jgi:hypothetical protein